MMISILDLISQGLLKPGDTLIYKRRSLGKKHTAVVRSDGTLVTEDGVIHKSPSGAAKHFCGRPVDGWIAWKIENSRVSLGALREKYKG